MSSFTYRIRSAVFSSLEGGSLGGALATITGDVEVKATPEIPAAASDYEVDFAVILTRLKALYILSTLDLTVKTNNASPDDTIDLKAGVPFYAYRATVSTPWTVSNGGSAPLTADVTKLLVTNADGSTAAQLDVRALEDGTPT